MKTLRKKIPVFFLIPTIIIFLLFSTTSIYLINYYIRKLAQNKVQYDLNSAHEIYYNELDKIKSIIRFSSKLYIIRKALAENNIKILLAELQRIRVEEHLDFITITDKYGYVTIRARNPKVNGDYVGDDIFVKKSLIGEIVSSTQIVNHLKLVKEDQELADIAYIKIIKTPKAIPSTKKFEDSGMVLKASAPIYDFKYNIIGTIYGGTLLNRNYYIVDKIKQTVFGNKNSGTATIFMDDLRISTNVRLKNGKRAIGTRVSKEVYKKVLLNGQKWINRAFVVNAWYITAYEPIFDVEKNIIGSLYVGILEEPFNKIQYNITAIFLTLLVISSIFTLLISFILARQIVKPITNLEKRIKKVASGNYEEFIEISSNDEIGKVENEFNNMINALKHKDRAISILHLNLEKKVKERTKELEEKNIQLIQAKEELSKIIAEKENLIDNYKNLQSELIHTSKLAAIGALASGVAHEINTPIAIIRGNLDVLEMFLEEKGFKNSKEMDIIKEQTYRMQRIVDRLLSFSRKKDSKLDTVDICQIIENICEPLKKETEVLGIKIIYNFIDKISIFSYETQLREVFSNIILNAIEAIKEKCFKEGELIITTKQEDNFMVVSFKDNGIGIEQENLRKIFNPFYTTKKDGTGLGLAISMSIIKNLGGDIKIFSEKNNGTEVKIYLKM